MKALMTIFLPAIVLISCSSPGNQKQSGDEKPATDSGIVVKKTDNKPTSLDDAYKPIGDSLEIPSFDIQVQLSDRAEQKLKDKKESIIVTAYFSGIPKDTTIKAYREEGVWSVASGSVELTSSRVAKMEGIKISKKDFDQLANKDINLLINIYSGRRSTPDNILDCDILEKPISQVMGQQFTIKGKLIGE
jgi:hypothetical protein